MKARYLSVQVAAGVVKTAADPAGELVEIDVLTAPATSRAQEPRPRVLVPHDRHAVPVHQNIRGVSGKLVRPVPASKLGHHPFRQRAAPVELVRIEASPAFDEVTSGEVRGVPPVEQSEAADHNGESSTYRPAREGTSEVTSKIGTIKIP